MTIEATVSDDTPLGDDSEIIVQFLGTEGEAPDVIRQGSRALYLQKSSGDLATYIDIGPRSMPTMATLAALAACISPLHDPSPDSSPPGFGKRSRWLACDQIPRPPKAEDINVPARMRGGKRVDPIKERRKIR